MPRLALFTCIISTGSNGAPCCCYWKLKGKGSSSGESIDLLADLKLQNINHYNDKYSYPKRKYQKYYYILQSNGFYNVMETMQCGRHTIRSITIAYTFFTVCAPIIKK